MDIAFAFDEGYAEHVPVAIESLLQTQPSSSQLRIWLLTTAGVMRDHGSALAEQLRGRAQLRLLSAGDEFRSLGKSARDVFSHISTGMYLRLMLPGRLPSGVQRLLYLDTDVLVYGDLSPLWQIPLGDSPLAAVRDAFTDTIGAKGGVPGAPADIDESAPYFNSGVLLMHLPVWRQMRVTERCLDYVASNRDRLRLPDQDALNLVTYGRWLELEPWWNDHVSWWSPAGEPERTRIMHFLGPKKPWHEDFRFTTYRERYVDLAQRVAFGAWIR